MTSDEFADMIISGNAPWSAKNNDGLSWSDSTKEQYFNFLTAEQANEMELERWRLNNEYNTPYNQMKRMIEAGINPAAAYQNVSTGNSSQAPDTHQPGTAAFHDTQDRLARINTIMNGISSIMSTIEHGVGAVQGIQDIQLSYQNNWYDALRAKMARGSLPATSTYWISKDPNTFPKSIEVAPGLYMEAGIAELFPEFTQGLGFAGGKYHQGEESLNIQTDLKNRRVRIDQLIQNIMTGLEKNEDESVMIKYFFELFMYGAMSKFGGF